VLAVIRDGVPIVEVAGRFGVPRRAVHRWLRWDEDQCLGGLTDRSHRPPRCSHQMDPATEVWMLETQRRNPDWGPRRLVHEARRAGAAIFASRVTPQRRWFSVGQVAWRLGVRPQESDELEAGERFPGFETWDRICKLCEWPQTFVGLSGSGDLGTVVARTPCTEPAGDLCVRVPPVGGSSDPIAVVLSVRREMFPACPAAFGGVVRRPRPAVFRTHMTEPFRRVVGGSHICGLPVLAGRETRRRSIEARHGWAARWPMAEPCCR
jgi:hypothetical protein